MARKKTAESSNAAAKQPAESPESLQSPQDKIELFVHIDFEADGRGVHIAPGVVLSHKIPPGFLQELLERGKARKL